MTQTTLSYRTNRDLFSNHYLRNHLPETEPWAAVDEEAMRAAYEEIRDRWTQRRERVEDYNEAQLERNFIRPVFEALGIPFEIEETVSATARRPDYGFFPSEEAADAAFDRDDFYGEAVAVADAKRWGRKLDTRGEQRRDFENPSYQIHSYLQETPTQWAVLTNGRRWRLYYGPTSHRLDSYYEIDLPTLLSRVEEQGVDGGGLETFKEFYLFFRHEAFLPDRSGDCFLDDVFDESSVFAEALGEDLQENIYEAIRVLAAGFLDTHDELGEDDLGLIHDSSLIYLYRLIFVLYAESEGRELLPTENAIYAESYSINELKREVVEKREATQQHYQSWQTTLWDRLEELFVLIDEGSQAQGIPKEDLYVPAYNGGLFRTSPDDDDSVESQFLASHGVGDAYLAEVLDLLTRHEAEHGEGRAFVDYSSLDERNLGSIYEGLLEYELEIADEPLAVENGEYVPAADAAAATVEAGEVYLRTDDGERKATGSYYTPEYVVEYIVDETLGPLVEEIKLDLAGSHEAFAAEFADRVFDLTILDPAMGSGHFPVNAVDYLAREIIDAQEQQDRQAIDAEDGQVRPPTTEEGELRDINWARRKVAQRCIYGVDVNPLATELSKVSLWLRTLAAEQPLAFLDHHLKTGNSLVGSDIEDVLADGEDVATDDGQLTLQQSFDHTRKRAMEHVTDRFQDLLSIDNETLADAKEMEAVYDDVREDPLYRKLLAMANVHTADAFGLDVPDDADERMARALHGDAWASIEGQDWFRSAQAMAEEERFFHWELEFPMAFYDQDGSRKADAGFDAVIGNPPYGAEFSESEENYLRNEFPNQDYQLDTYLLFIEKGLNLARSGREFGMIVPNTWLPNLKLQSIRKLLFKEKTVQKIRYYKKPVFENVTVDTLVLLARNERFDEDHEIGVEIVSEETDEYHIPQNRWADRDGEPVNVFERPEIISISDKLRDNPRLEQFCDVTQGTKPFQVGKGTPEQTREIVDEKPYVSDEKETEEFRPLLSGKHVHRYVVNWDSDYWIKFGDWLAEPRYSANYDAQQKILVRQTADSLIATLDTEQFIVRDNLYTIVCGRDFDLRYLLAIVNSKLLNWYYQQVINPEKGEALAQVKRGHIAQLPIRPEDSIDATVSTTDIGLSLETVVADDCTTLSECICELVDTILEAKERREALNLDLLDYLGNYDDGPQLPDIGVFQPSTPDYLDATSEAYENLRIGDVRVERAGDAVAVEATARYKPEDEEAYETDQWGYTETDYETAFRLTGLGETEAALVAAFVPVAADEAGGFAGFRETATKTNSLLDRLKAMVLPDPDDVADDLRRYVENRERADELDEKIERTDALIDEIVYELYDLTDEEIEVVEEAVGE